MISRKAMKMGYSRRKRGVVLVVVLAALAGILAGIAIYSMNQNDAVRSTLNRTEERRARVAAEAGIQYAMATLETVADNPQNPATLNDDWATLGNNGADNFILGNGSFRLQIVDNSSFLDVNSITEATLSNLPLTQEQIDSFLDWRETAQTSTRTDGGKDEYYNALQKPYNTREGVIRTVNELLQIKGWTPDTLYQVQTNTVNTNRTNNNTPESPLIQILGVGCYSGAYNPEGNGKANVNQPTLTAQQLSTNAQVSIQVATAILAARNARPNRTFAQLSQVLTVQGVNGNQAVIRSVLDRMCISGATRIEGLVNINTATAETLSYINGITEDIANQIVDSRPSNGYTNLSDILTVSGANSFITAAADNLTVNTQSFTIRVVGKAGRTTVSLEALVGFANKVPTILKVEESSFSNMTDRWSWADSANDTTLLENK